MEVVCQSEDNSYKVRLEFADLPSNVGEEIREFLKEKYIREKGKVDEKG